MMSQQRNQNLPAFSQSLLQQTGSGVHVKPFSIREYVAASRHGNILHNWPFREKQLQLCFKHGLKEVLPPLGLGTSLDEPLKGFCSNLMHSPNDNNNEADSCKADEPHLIDDGHPKSIRNECDKVIHHTPSHEEGNQPNCNISADLPQPADTCTIPSSNQVRKNSSLLPSPKVAKDKRRKRRVRCKKRSMVDILAVARHSTLEEIQRMGQFCYAETLIIEECQQTVPCEKFSKSEQAGENSFRKTGSEAHIVDMTPKGPLLLKFKLNGCNVNRNC